MNIYGTTTNCPKCGNKTFNDSYEENIVCIADKNIINGVNGYEAIARTCDNCGYVFLEATLDSKQTQGVGG